MAANPATPPTMCIRTCAGCGEEFRTSEACIRYKCPHCRFDRKKLQRLPVLGDQLTPREKQIADLVGRGFTNPEVAGNLYLTEGTIKEYLFALFRKAGVRNRTEFALWWRDRNETNVA